MFTLLPPTDILYLEEREFQTMKYKIKKKGIHSDYDTVSDQATLVGRVKQSDLELTSFGCPSETCREPLPRPAPRTPRADLPAATGRRR